jgi:hypothetical protein
MLQRGVLLLGWPRGVSTEVRINRGPIEVAFALMRLLLEGSIRTAPVGIPTKISAKPKSHPPFIHRHRVDVDLSDVQKACMSISDQQELQANRTILS